MPLYRRRSPRSAASRPSVRKPLSSLSLALVVILASIAAPPPFHAAAPVSYRFTIPEPQHHWMQVEATFTELGAAPLELHMSRSSPGRYSIHDFAKNVYDVHALAQDGRELTMARPDPSVWTIAQHGGAVTVNYKIYGDRVDGTYLAIDTSHVHMNMPAAIMWARGFDDAPATLTFSPPGSGFTGRAWTVATQLHPGSRPFEFTAPNLQYLMDSPVEFGPIALRQFSVGSRTFRFAAHHTGTEAELDRFVQDVERIVREEGAIYGEFPEYEPGTYTFLADYLPYADGDGMEHRNSTVMTSSASIQSDRPQLLETVSHEFFHCWNVERIRPRDLEPFDLDRANISSELWLAEGFTQYYGPLALQRAGLMTLDETSRTFGLLVDTVVTGPGRAVRSAEDMSRMAAFIDGSRTIDRTNWPSTVISYYPFGAAIALALDLTLRDRSEGAITLDDYMRQMWRAHGKPGGMREGYVDRPYTTEDAEARLAEVSGDRVFAKDFFDRYIRGREVADYARLLPRAGFVVRKRSPGRAWWGDVRIESHAEGPRIDAVVAPGSPAYAAGLDQDDTVLQVAGERVTSPEAINTVLSRHRPGERVPIVYVDRQGASKTAIVGLVEDPHVEVVAVEAARGTLTAAQRTFRDRWLKSRQ
jgi:predicted metalloprotease with PDZ domain